MPSKNPAAVELGRLGGLAKSEKKTIAARENAKKSGGRKKGAKDRKPRKRRTRHEAQTAEGNHE